MKKLSTASMFDTVFAVSTGGDITECEIYSVSRSEISFIKQNSSRYNCSLDDAQVIHGGTVSIYGNLRDIKFYTLDKKKALTLAIELRNNIVSVHLANITQLTKDLMHV